MKKYLPALVLSVVLPISSVAAKSVGSTIAQPAINELLPRPLPVGSSPTNQFIELFNPKSIPFDLGGYSLQVGTNHKKVYVFPAGTSLPARSFTAFYSSQTQLILNSLADHAFLFDRKHHLVAQSVAYTHAPADLSWANNSKNWRWSKPTPNAPNAGQW
jgi:hypothetical protein